MSLQSNVEEVRREEEETQPRRSTRSRESNRESPKPAGSVTSTPAVAAATGGVTPLPVKNTDAGTGVVPRGSGPVVVLTRTGPATQTTGSNIGSGSSIRSVEVVARTRRAPAPKGGNRGPKGAKGSKTPKRILSRGDSTDSERPLSVESLTGGESDSAAAESEVDVPDKPPEEMEEELRAKTAELDRKRRAGLTVAGEYVRMAEARAKVAQARKLELDTRVMAEVAARLEGATRAFPKRDEGSMADVPLDELMASIEEAVSVVETVAKKSRNLQGGMVKSLKHSSGIVRAVSDELTSRLFAANAGYERGAAPPVPPEMEELRRRMGAVAGENRRLRREVEALKEASRTHVCPLPVSPRASGFGGVGGGVVSCPVAMEVEGGEEPPSVYGPLPPAEYVMEGGMGDDPLPLPPALPLAGGGDPTRRWRP